MLDYKGCSVLVTGGAGFIGSHLTEEFVRRGAAVTVVDNLSTGYISNLAAVVDRIDLRQLDLVRDDIRLLLTEKKFKTIVHLAANADIPASIREPRADFEKNAVATLNLLDAVHDVSPQSHILHTSSATVYGRGANAPLREDAPAAPISPYAVSKLCSENYMAIYAQLYGLRTAILRLFPVYGPRLRKQVVYDLMMKIRANPDELSIQGDGKQLRDFNHIANVVEAYFVVAKGGSLNGEAYNIAAEETVTIHDLAQMICGRMNVAPRFVYSGDARSGDMQKLTADTSRLKTLGYRSRVNFADGLDDTIAWFREENDKAALS